MDFIVGLHKVGNKYVIMVVVEYLSKYAHFFILKKPYMPLIITQVFMDHILNYLEVRHTFEVHSFSFFVSQFFLAIIALPSLVIT